MCIATIVFEDIDQVNGQFRVNVDVADASTADGLASAAHVTSMFISEAVRSPQFAEGAVAYAQARGWTLRNDLPQVVTMTLTDVDLDAGSFDVKLVESEDAIVDNSVTAAYMTALFVRDAMGSNEFRIACTEYAYALIAGHPSATVNEPTIQPAVANTDVDQKAA